MASKLGPKARQLALALAGGQTVADWAKATDTPERTAYRLAGLDSVKDLVATLQGRILDGAVRKLAAGSTAAADTLVRLLGSKDERVALRAARAILDNYASFHSYVDLERRVAEMERRAEREGSR